ncbi:MAG: histidine phosphatase family protein [Candidatus Woesebacteria bacterium]|nr:histidine phosphatase family protein [Candidatus Woesebacteria bacterium]
MNKYYLIRHGQKTGHAGDPELTEHGKIQAAKTGEYFREKNIFEIFSSTYNRTKETSDIINKILNIEIKYDDRLRERMNWGSIPDQTLEDFLQEWEYSNHHRDFKPKAGLSSLESGNNAFEALTEINNQVDNKNILVVTHGGVISDLLRNIFDEKELIKNNPSFIIDKLDQLMKECSITTITFDNNKFKLIEIASVKHLV